MNNENRQLPQSALPTRKNEISLYPGELYIHTRGKEPRIWTLLGSCVSVVLFNPVRGVGAICHAQLAEQVHLHQGDIKACTDTDTKESRFRYMNCAFEHMLHILNRKGIPSAELSAYLLGGAAVGLKGGDFFNVGARNLDMARKLLKENGIKILREETGGNRGMTLYFYPATGDLYYRYHGQSFYSRFNE